jgi:2-dehydro-3-deoxyphosphogluconate aldolase/(4S)-4-hydroxy-2-oxoglutarate aldolase
MQDAPVIPVIVLNDVAHAVPMARALVAGGIRMLEVTLRTPQALACIEAIAKRRARGSGGRRHGAHQGRCTSGSQAGARFAVSPGYTSAVGQACRDAGLALLPGVATGSEIMMAQEDGFTELKFFPAMQAGGPAMLKAWSGPFFDVRFCPTGGVTLQNAPRLSGAAQCGVCGRLLAGTCRCSGGSAIGHASRNWPGIRRSCKANRALALVG